MKPIDFKESQYILAKDQPEYLPLPVNITEYENKQFIFTSCWQLNFIERIKLLFSGKIWCRQLVFHALQPQELTTIKPKMTHGQK